MQFDIRTMAEHMGAVAWAVVIVLFIMSMYSIAVMIERYWTYRQATLQSRKYAPEVARYLKAGKIQEAIKLARDAGVAVIAAVTDQRPMTVSTVSTESPRAGH